MLAGILSAILPTLGRTIEKVVPDPALRDKLNAEITTALLANEAQIKRSAAEVIMAEVTGESWLQRNWRPLLMVNFAVLINAYWFGMTPPNLSEARIEDLFQLVMIGVGGYVVGRSGEKMVKSWAGKDKP